MVYDIDEIITQCVDPETGEVDVEKLDALTMERNTKLENLALWYKDLEAEKTAVKAESDKLKQRAERLEKKAENLKAYLFMQLKGEKFKTPKCSVGYRTTKAVWIEPDFDIESLPEEYKRVNIEVKADKKKIKDAIESGASVNGCELIEKRSMLIK